MNMLLEEITMSDRAILVKTIEKIEGAYAPSTIRAYKANFERFIKFSENHQTRALPAAPENVANYVAHLAKSNLKSSSIRIAVASISSIHKLNSLNDPTQHPDIKIEMRHMHRTLGRQSKQAYGITEHILEKMLCATTNNLRGLRDRALLLLAYDSMCRRSEITSLKISDIRKDIVENQAQLKVRLRKSKTDQELQGKWIFLTKRSADAIENWIKEAELIDGFLFRGVNNAIEITHELQSSQINRIYKRLAKDANLPNDIIDHISGHSMRVGAAQDLLKSGTSMPIIMNRGRWIKTDTVMRYLEGARNIK